MAAQNDHTPTSARSISEWDAWVAEHPDLDIRAADESMFKVKAPEMWPDAVAEALENEKAVRAARIVLGDKYDAWTATGANAAYLFQQIAKAAGLDVGESSASSR